MTATYRDRLWLAIAALTLLGLCLRVLAARGGLWLDEAWSATFAQEVVTPIGVIWRVNHDNNHILNTLWLQLVGPDAPPLLQRGFAIVSGAAAIPLAALFCARRSTIGALTAALFFAISPILVTYGSEARGYAPMIAAALTMFVLVDRWLYDGAPLPAIGLAITALVGMLAHVLMILPLLSITAWLGFLLWRRRRFRAAFWETFRALAPSLAAAASVLLVMLIAAQAAPEGFTIGNYRPFDHREWVGGIAGVVQWTLGIGRPSPLNALAGAVIALVLLVAGLRSDRALLYALLIFGVPLGYALCQIGNVGIARYYLPSIVGLLLLAADALGEAAKRGGGFCWMAIVAIALFSIGAARLDRTLIVERRADPEAAIDVIRAYAPAGTLLMLPDVRLTPVLEWAARAAHYPLRIAGTSCSPAPFLLLDSDHPVVQPQSRRLCCGTYHVVASRRTEGLSGTDWWLYRRVAP